MRPPKYVLGHGGPAVINEKLTEVIHLISANGKKLSEEEIKAIETLLSLCKYFDELEPVYEIKSVRPTTE